MKLTTVVTGLGWMGTGIRSVQSGLREMLQSARQEVMLCAYSVSGGADDILIEFENCLNRGIKFTAIINRFEHQPMSMQIYLLNLIDNYSYCQIYSFNNLVEELHAKIVIVDRRIALVGSANLSMRGMKQNYEIGVIFEGSEASIVSCRFDDLLSLNSVSLVTHKRS